VIISAEWVGEIDWNARTVHLSVPRDRVAAAPEYTPGIASGSARQEEEIEHALHLGE
jgi:hypothetical protein